MEADFQHFYHLDLRDFLIGKDSPARALRLISYLPEGGAFRSTMNAQPQTKGRRREPSGWEKYYGWTHDTYVMSSLYSAVMALAGAKDPTYPGFPGENARKGRPLIPSDKE